MKNFLIARRHFLKVILGSGLLSLIGCTKPSNKYVLKGDKDTIPRQVMKSLPPNWRFEAFDYKETLDPRVFDNLETSDLVAYQDGWLEGLSHSVLKNICKDDIYSSLDNQAQDFIDGFGSDFYKKILPIGASPWVMIFRNGGQWLDRANLAWDVLLDQNLKKQIVFPNSPRLMMSIADRIGEPDALKILRHQVKTFDDRNAMNWLISGRARLAILPLQRCIKNIKQDPRLKVALPKMGAPLNWTVFVQPTYSNYEFSLNWLKQSWESESIKKLLIDGWIPPIPYPKILDKKINFRSDFNSFIPPSKNIWDKCWSLTPLTIDKKNDLVKRWIESAP